MDFKLNYENWISNSFFDEKIREELMKIQDEKEIEDRFYKDLEFGTGGLRGVMAAGTNRMNIYTIMKATKGLSVYINEKYKKDAKVAIAYDSRNNSKLFAEVAASVLCANKIKVYLFESLRPTPMLSFTVRHKGCSAGIVITASHNPKEYNGYKVYGSDGGQITDKAAAEILSHINSIEDYATIEKAQIKNAEEEGYLTYIGEDVDRVYYEKVKSLIIRKKLVKEEASKLKIIYTPIHGSGNVPVRRVLKELGFTNLTVVPEQEKPDGNFPTASYPNPENPSVFNIALKMAEKVEPDLIFGTDPDCDRIGVVVKNNDGEYKVLTGNQTGALLTEYLLSSLKEENKLDSSCCVIKTIVTTDLAKKIASNYNVQLLEVLTGFKYIGEKVKEFEKQGNKRFILGFEESYGYLSGTFVRDKDAVIASTLICEMALYFRSKGLNLYDALNKIYEKYGYFKENLISIELKGIEGKKKINTIMEYLRKSMGKSFNNINIETISDYSTSVVKNLITNVEQHIDLPKSNVLKVNLCDGSWFVVRPSGTEPKIKIYLSVYDKIEKIAMDKINSLKESIMLLINEI